jgi:type II secretory pathway pseudopilin PulG
VEQTLISSGSSLARYTQIGGHMDKSKALFATAFTILGIIVGALLNNYLISERETNRDLFSARLQAYNEFMEGQALRKKAETEENHKVANEIITRGKFKLAMLGTEETLSSMVKYWQADPQSGRSLLEKRRRPLT